MRSTKPALSPIAIYAYSTDSSSSLVPHVAFATSYPICFAKVSRISMSCLTSRQVTVQSNANPSRSFSSSLTLAGIPVSLHVRQNAKKLSSLLTKGVQAQPFTPRQSPFDDGVIVVHFDLIKTNFIRSFRVF